MCGIVGYTGPRPVAEVLIDGLRKLEYRGYDSAGVALQSPSGIVTVKAVGKVVNLEKLLASDHSQAAELTGAGIAHTRWATHGVPSCDNAHPHNNAAGTLAIVHNGIIDNYLELRSSLEERGTRFCSQTDSEALAHLIDASYSGDLLQAVATALRQVAGTYALAVIHRDHPGVIVAARRGSPLLIGVGDEENVVAGDEENVVASDASALVAYTRRVIFLDDGDLAVVTPASVEIRTLKNVPVNREIAVIDWDVSAAQKGDYAHFMLKEIYEQPQAVANTLRGRLDHDLDTASLPDLDLSPRELAGINRIVIAACGTSMHAGMVGEYLFEDIAGIPAQVEQAAEFRYRNPIIEPNTLVLPVSQSGETADTLAAVREAATKGAVIAAVCNVVGSTIARESGRVLYLHAGPEISVASTKAFTCQVTALLLLTLLLGRNRRLDHHEGMELIREIERIPELIRKALGTAERVRQVAERFAGADNFFYIGRGCLYPTALEGALKLKEISYIHAEGYHAAELKHGPIALLDEKVPVLALANAIPGKEKMLASLQECRARRAPVIAVATEGDAEVAGFADEVIYVPACSRYTAPLPTVVVLQLFAYYVAVARGCEVDQPRNLAKSVTVE